MARLVLKALVGSLALGAGAAAPVDHMLEARNFAAEAGLTITDNFHALPRIRRPPGLSRTLDVLRQNRRNYALMNDIGDDEPEGVDKLRAEMNQVEYIMKVGVGAEAYYMIPDTGSSDTWVISEGFKCLDPSYGIEVPQEECGFGPLFRGEFPDGRIDSQNLNISYMSGEYLNGPMGFANITVANVTVPKQQFALVNVAAFGGDGISSGILGLGLRGLTASFTGNDPRNDSIDNLVNYSPLIETMGKSKVADPVVSFAMSRDENRSFIAFGGVPPVKTGEYTAVPIQKRTTYSGKTDYFYYDIKIDSMSWSSKTVKQTATNLPNILVDSGTTINLFPRQVAAAINRAYSPPGQQEDSMIWSVACDAVPPVLDIVIGGRPIRTHPSSMILPETAIPGTNICLSGIGAGQSGSYILGDTFMQEIVAVFDVSDKMELKFAQRLD
ncbi:aspartic peptidase domain-containing protein [Durotheca rogersii]|uniref:aspartic peptidase domain-containing protein n=1 Tax=Durotheca rogersii TaxID=419775 RepID=UPI00221F54C0|nr:aspartic peptidase domain-containing protein [Durotheca rogersii]KAI5865553.1 aspartic peptidase domain-containing protein [Durotheca rogersii]